MEYTTKTIDELCEKITDGAHNSPEECIDGPYPMYSSKDMLYGGFSDSDVKRISVQDYEKLVAQDCQPQKNDILIIKDGANYLKYAFKIPERLDAVILSSIAILRPNTKIIDPDYFTYLLRTDSIRRAMSNFVSGAAIPRIVLKDFKRMKLRFVTDTNCQREIANILISYDNLIEANNKRIKVLEQMAENLYKEWFVRFRFPGYESAEFENGIPKGWENCKFSTIANILSGGTPSTEHEEYYGGNILFYTPKDSTDSFYVFDTIIKLTEEGLNHCNSQLYPQNTIMITARGTVGNLNLLATPMAMNQSCYAINSDVIHSQYFLFFLLKREIQKIKKIASGGVFDTIIVNTFDHIKVTIPNDNLIDKFDILVAPIMRETFSLLQQNINLIKQRNLLLPRLMSGKLEV